MTIQELILSRLKVHSHEVVPFDVFRSSIFTCLVLTGAQLCSKIFASNATQQLLYPCVY